MGDVIDIKKAINIKRLNEGLGLCQEVTDDINRRRDLLERVDYENLSAEYKEKYRDDAAVCLAQQIVDDPLVSKIISYEIKSNNIDNIDGAIEAVYTVVFDLFSRYGLEDYKRKKGS